MRGKKERKEGRKKESNEERK
jgi:hypothetical protein